MEQNVSKSRKKIVTIIIFLIIFGILVYWVGIQVNQWWQVRKEYVRMGLAEDKFPFRMYTERELVEMGRWPVESTELAKTPTRRTPEETYAQFRQALIEEDFEKAAEYFVKEKREGTIEGLKRVKEGGFLQEMLDDLPERLEDTYEYEKRAEEDLNNTALMSYDYVAKSDPERFLQTMSFVKDWNGDWFIGDL